MAKRMGRALLDFVHFMVWWYVVPPALIFAAFVDEPLVWLVVVGLLVAVVVARIVFIARRRSLPRKGQ
jgi:hypothetical protein